MKLLLLIMLMQSKPFGMEINGELKVIMPFERYLVGYHCLNENKDAVYIKVREGSSVMFLLIVAGSPDGPISVKYPASPALRPNFILRAKRLTATASFDQSGTRPAVVRYVFDFDDSTEAQMNAKILRTR